MMFEYPAKRLLFIGIVAMLFGVNALAPSDTERFRHKLEKSVCGLKEPFYFWLWSTSAGSPDPSRLQGESAIEHVNLKTKDGRLLRGYKLQTDAETPKGFLLVAQGNAMLADQIILGFRAFAAAGYDVYIYDYRGYGRSEGKRRLKAMLSDYREIIGSLDILAYKERLFYGMSYGGILLLDALKEDRKAKKVVIDSTPSRLSSYGCPERYDPLLNLPSDCSEFFVIGGMADSVVPPASSEELRERAHSRGATVLLDPQLGHPFMDREPQAHRRRMDVVRTFLTVHLRK
jgi:pimeloyl-ACP methyl ester carboxylesterase